MSQSWVPSFLKESYKGGGEIAIRSQLLTDRTIFYRERSRRRQRTNFSFRCYT